VTRLRSFTAIYQHKHTPTSYVSTLPTPSSALPDQPDPARLTFRSPIALSLDFRRSLQGVAIVPAHLLRGAPGYDRVLSDADVPLLATTAWTSPQPAA
jgi:hypothetical protein